MKQKIENVGYLKMIFDFSMQNPHMMTCWLIHNCSKL